MPLVARHELPVYSPLTPTSLAAALTAPIRIGPDAEARARALLLRKFGATDVALVDSGRSALQLAIQASVAKDPRRIVALPAFQCFEVASAAVGADCRIALYDVDPATLQPDLESLERALREGACAVVVAPLFGLPVNWSAITALTSRFGAAAIEDAAQGHGAEWRGRPLGSLGELSVLSFGRGKGWTGCGGGALLARTGSSSLSSVVLPRPSAVAEFRLLATATMQLAFGNPALYGVPASIPSLGLGETRYRAPTPPRRAAALSIALVTETEAGSASEVQHRRRNAEYWRHALPDEYRDRVPSVLPDSTAGYLRFPMRVPAWRGLATAPESARRAGIARSYPTTLGELPAVAARLTEPTRRYPGAAALSADLVTLPTHSGLTDASRRDVVRILTSIAR